MNNYYFIDYDMHDSYYYFSDLSLELKDKIENECKCEIYIAEYNEYINDEHVYLSLEGFCEEERLEIEEHRRKNEEETKLKIEEFKKMIVKEPKFSTDAINYPNDEKLDQIMKENNYIEIKKII